MPAIKDKHTDHVLARIDKIAIMLTDNPKNLGSKRSGEFTKLVMEDFGVSQRTAQRDIAEAKKAVRKICNKNLKESYKRAMLDREYLFQKAKEKKEYRTALEVIKDREKLIGLYPMGEKEDDLTIEHRKALMKLAAKELEKMV